MGVRAKNEHGGSGWRNSPPAGPYTPPPPPAAVASVSVTRADGALTASWDAPAGATSYHVTYTDNDFQSWQLAALDHAATSITIDADNDKTYVVGVRAKNDSGGSNWRNSPASGPYTPPAPIVPPAAPTGLTATGGDGSVTLNWDDPSDSSITHYVYRWRAAPPAPGWSQPVTVPNSDASTTSYTIEGLTNGTQYRFKLQAANAQGESPQAPRGAPWYVAATPLAGPVTITADNETSTTADLTIGNWSGAWYYRAENASGGAAGASVTCIGPVSGTQTTVTGLDPDTRYTITAYANNCAGEAMAAGQAITQAGTATLTASDVTYSTATLTISGHTGNWFHKESAPGTGTCERGRSSPRKTVAKRLTPGVSYTFKAYSDSQCATEVTSDATDAEFKTSPVVLSTIWHIVPEGSSEAHTVWLSQRPTADVTVTVATSGDSDITANPSTLTFTPSNWSRPQTVTLTAAQDTDTVPPTGKGDGTYAYGATTVTHTAASADAHFNSASVALNATEGDDDVCSGALAVAYNTSGGVVEDCDTLLAAKSVINGSGTDVDNWGTGAALGTWTGVTVANNRVTKLELGVLAYTLGVGNLPNTIADLDALTHLEMDSGARATLPGPMPPDLGSLTGLTVIGLYNRELTGPIPDNIGNITGLTELALDNNRLSGPLPASLANLTSLTKLWLNGNRLTGEIPAQLGSLTAMTTANFKLGSNLLSGCVPPGWSKYLSEINPQQDASGNNVNLPLCIGKPAKPTAVAKNHGATVSWTAPTGRTVTGYEVQWRPCQTTYASPNNACLWKDSHGSWHPAWAPWGTGKWLVGSSGTVTVGASPTSKALSGLNNGVRYQVRVRGFDGTGQGPWSEPSDDVWPNPPGLNAPTALGASHDSSNKRITIDWTRPSGVTGSVNYEAQCSKDSGASWTACGTVGNTTDASLRLTHTYTGSTSNVPDKVQVRAIQRGNPSRWVQSGIGRGDPSNLSASYASGTLTITWQGAGPTTSAYAYHVESSADGATWTREHTINSVTQASFSHTVSTGGIAQVRVRAIDSSSNASAWLEATVPGPANVGAQVQGTTLKLRWDKPSGASGALSYTVQCNNDATGGTWTQCHTESATSDATITASVASQASVKRVRVNASQNSVAGPWTVASVPTGVPGVPGGLQVTIIISGGGTGGGSELTRVVWTKPSGTKSTDSFAYEVTCSDDNEGTWTYCSVIPHMVASTTNTNLSANFDGKPNTTNVRVVTIQDGLRSATASWSKTPGAPANVGAQVQGTTLKLRWDRPAVASGALAYTVGCNNSASGGTWDDTCHTVTGSSAISLTASVNNKGSVQRVRVKATQNSVDGAWTTVAVPSGVPGAVGGLGAQLQGTTLKARWDKPSGASGSLSYTMECNNNATGTTGWTSCKTVSATANAVITVSVDNKGSVKRVRARAERDGLQGAWTTGAVPSGLPAAPSSVILNTIGSSKSGSLGKPAGVTGAVTYRVQCSTDVGTTWTACDFTVTSSDTTPQVSLPSSASAANALRARTERDGLHSSWVESD